VAIIQYDDYSPMLEVIIDMKTIVATLVTIISVNMLWAQHPTVEPWEPEDLHNTSMSQSTSPPSFLTPLTQIVIGVYQKNASQTSIERCPFHTSCSRFAIASVHQYGLLGICMFIDRFFYREHLVIQFYYPYRTNTKGVLKLDDHQFHTLY